MHAAGRKGFNMCVFLVSNALTGAPRFGASEWLAERGATL